MERGSFPNNCRSSILRGGWLKVTIYNNAMAFIHEILPLRLKPAVWAILATAILAILAVIAFSFSQPRPVALSDPQAQEIAAALQSSEHLLSEVACNPAVGVEVLNNVLADWSGYRLNASARAMVVRVYGESAAAGAGFLTYRKAYYLSVRGEYPGADATPASDLRPTSRPQIYCPTPVTEITLSIQSIAIGTDRAVARYRVASYALQEAVLIKVEGRWKIGDLKYLERNN